jgi:integrase
VARLTEGYATKLRLAAGVRDTLVFDDALPGFFLRKFASGKASYGVKYNIGTLQRRMSLGPVVPGVLAERRKMAADILAKARLGIDVVGERQAVRNKQTITLGHIVPKYLAAREGELRSKTLSEISRYLERTWEPLHAYAIETVTRQMIVGVIDDIERASGNVAADRARTALSGLYAWAIDRGYLEASPTLNIRSRAQNGTRQRVLSETELVAVWKICEGLGDYGAVVRLLILTGQRRTELGDLAWSEIDLDKAQIELASERTKNGRPHVVPLNKEALAILAGIPRRPGRDLLFGIGSGGFSAWSKAKAALDDWLPTDMPPWVLHDLRRSFVTHVSERGFATPHVVEAIVNHVSGSKAGVAGIYNKAAYAVEKRQALEVWGAHVAALVEGRVTNMASLSNPARRPRHVTEIPRDGARGTIV